MQKNLVGKSEQGFGLLEIIIAAGLLALIVAVMNQNIVISINSQRSVEARGDKEDVKRRLVESIDCTETFKPEDSLVCKSDGLPVDIKRKSGAKILAKEGQKIGSWTYRPICQVSGSAITINVQALRFKPNKGFDTPQINLFDKNNFIKDPMTNAIITLPDPALPPPNPTAPDKSLLFDSGAELCQGNKKLVFYQGTYASGQSNPLATPGRPKFVMIFNPFTSGGSAAAYCMKIDDPTMPGDVNLCGIPSANFSKIRFSTDSFSVSGQISTATNSLGPASYPNFAYFGFAEARD